MNAPAARAVARAPVRERSSKGRRSKKAQKLLAQIFGADQAAALCRRALLRAPSGHGHKWPIAEGYCEGPEPRAGASPELRRNPAATETPSFLPDRLPLTTSESLLVDSGSIFG